MSDKLTASDLCPSAYGAVSAKKCVPATNVSVETANSKEGFGLINAASSPIPSIACVLGWEKKWRMMSNSEFNLKSSAGWCLEYVIVSFWQSAMKSEQVNNELQCSKNERIAYYKHHSAAHQKGI